MLVYRRGPIPGAELFVGLKRGREPGRSFEQKIRDGHGGGLFFTGFAVGAGRRDVSCRAVVFHALGAGLRDFRDPTKIRITTYRVFDWNRVGLDGKPGANCTWKKSLASIDFEDFEPRLIQSIYSRNETIAVRYLVDDPLFRVDACRVKRGGRFHLRSDGLQIIGPFARGNWRFSMKRPKFELDAGQFAHAFRPGLGRVSLQANKQGGVSLHVQNR